MFFRNNFTISFVSGTLVNRYQVPVRSYQVYNRRDDGAGYLPIIAIEFTYDCFWSGGIAAVLGAALTRNKKNDSCDIEDSVDSHHLQDAWDIQ